MPITIACPHCDWKGRVKDELAGKKGKCPTCGELFPIPMKGTPPPVPGGKRSVVDDEPDVVDDADIVEEKPRRMPKRPSNSRRDDDDDRPTRSRRQVDDEDEDDRPIRSRQRVDDEDDDDRPSKSRRRPVDDDDDDRPRKKKRLADDEDDDRPSRSRRRAEDDDDDDPPRKKKRPLRRRQAPKKSSVNSKRIGAVLGGLFALLVGGAWLAWFLLGDGRFRVYPIFLLVAGLVGLIQGFTGAGLGSDDSDDDDGY